MNTSGNHVLFDMYGCGRSVNGRQGIMALMLQAAEKMGAEVLHSHFHEFPNGSVTGFVLLAESHMSIHTWVEKNYVSVDTYTCGTMDYHLAEIHIRDYFKPAYVDTQYKMRGALNE